MTEGRSKRGDFERDSPEQAARQTRRKHIFAVNCAPEFLDFLRELFQDERYNVTTTNYVDQTFDMIRVLEPDLVMLDLSARSTQGQDLIAQLNGDRFQWDLPLIVTSTDPGVLEEARRIQPERAGDRRYMVKPLDVNDLLTTVHEVLVSSAEG